MLKYRHHDSVCTVVPLKLRREILDLAHSKRFSGDLGIFKTHSRIPELFWWPGLYEDNVNFISNCEICMIVKLQHRNPGRMGIKEFPCTPMELVSIDFLVELPVTARDNRRIMCMNDHFTKFIQIYPVSNRPAKTAAKCVFDFEREREREREREIQRLRQKLFLILMELFGVKKLRTTWYNPRANGLTEKCNEFIKNCLTSCAKFSKKERDLWCREAAFTYNSSVHSSTGSLHYPIHNRNFYHIEIKDLQEAPAVKRNTYYFRSFLTFVRVFLFSYVKTNTISHLEFMLYIKVRLR